MIQQFWFRYSTLSVLGKANSKFYKFLLFDIYVFMITFSDLVHFSTLISFDNQILTTYNTNYITNITFLIFNLRERYRVAEAYIIYYVLYTAFSAFPNFSMDSKPVLFSP